MILILVSIFAILVSAYTCKDTDDVVGESTHVFCCKDDKNKHNV